MEELSGLNQNNCLACLCEIVSNTYLYSFRLQVLVEVLQLQEVPLCDKCYKQANEAETFIQNVIDNQKLLKDFIKNQLTNEKNILNVYPKTEFTTQIEISIDCNTEQTKIKTEKIFEEDIFKYDNEHNVNIKEEPVEESKSEIASLSSQFSENKKLVSTQKSVKKKVVSKQLKSANKNDAEKVPVKVPLMKMRGVIPIQTLTLTLEECMKEREEAANEMKYLARQWKCADCVKGFTVKDGFDQHMTLHSEARGDHECDICKLRYPTAEKVMEHKNNSHFMRYKCPECDLVRIQRATICAHYETYHADQKDEYECLLCATKYPCYLKLRKHVKRSHSDKIYKCPHCDMTLSCAKTLKKHITRIHTKDESTFIRPRPYTCDECGSSFRTKSLLALHLVKHSDTKQHYCVECDKYFKFKNTLFMHYKTAEPHVKYENMAYQCSECDRKFSTKSYLTTHMKRIHYNQSFKCDKCDKTYKDRGSLKKHQSLIHNGYIPPKKYACSICEKTFSSSTVLKRHVIIHSGERPFACTKCTATFASNSALYHHNNLVHLKKKRNRDLKRASKAKRKVDDEED